ncbi:MAG: cache domain-containing protein [Chloroflexi bacterium]|nr:cache domain-containing protein [Chloroflexota bacterium]
MKLLTLTLALALGPLITLGTLDGTWARDAPANDTERAMLSGAQTTANSIDRINADHIQRATLLAATDRAHAAVIDPNADRGRILELLQAFLASNPSFDGVSILDTSGRTVVSTDERMYGKTYDFRPYFEQAIAGVPNVSPLSVSIDTLGPQIVYAAPIEQDGQIVGVTAIRSNASEVFDLIDRDAGALGTLPDTSQPG